MLIDDCLFCKIIRGEIPADKVYEDDKVLAFRDINPQAPTHVLIIPKKHIATVHEVAPEDGEFMNAMIAAAQKVAELEGLEKDGYRLVINCQEGAGQTVFHLHMHIVGGRSLQWPPG